MILNPVVNIKGQAMIAFFEKEFGIDHLYTIDFKQQWTDAVESPTEMIYDVFIEYDENGLRVELPAFGVKVKEKA